MNNARALILSVLTGLTLIFVMLALAFLACGWMVRSFIWMIDACRL